MPKTQKPCFIFRGYVEHRIVIAADDQQAARKALDRLGHNWTQAGGEHERQASATLELIEIHRPGMSSYSAVLPDLDAK